MGSGSEEARRRAWPEQRRDRVLRCAGGERLGKRGDAVRQAPPDGPRTGGDGQEDAQARLDATRERPCRPSPKGAAAAGHVRLPAGLKRGRDAVGAKAGRVVDGGGCPRSSTVISFISSSMKRLADGTMLKIFLGSRADVGAL